MKLLRTIAIGLVTLVALLAVIGFFLPAKVEVSRSIDVAASQHTVYTVLTSLKSFNAWSPWGKRDPEMTLGYDGPPVGVGQRASWSSSKPDVGTGSQEIIAAVPDESIKTRLVFAGNGEAEATFKLAPSPLGTQVTWSLSTDLGGNPFYRYMGLMFPAAIGKDYEEGLAGLKLFVERLPKVDFTDMTIEHVTTKADTLLVTRVSMAKAGEGFGAALDEGLARLRDASIDMGLEPSGYPTSIAASIKDDRIELDVAVPVEGQGRELVAPAGVQVERSYEGPAIRATHIGPYEGLAESGARLLTYAAAVSAEPAGPSWNEYASNPSDVPESEVITYIYLPVK